MILTNCDGVESGNILSQYEASLIGSFGEEAIVLDRIMICISINFSMHQYLHSYNNISDVIQLIMQMTVEIIMK